MITRKTLALALFVSSSCVVACGGGDDGAATTQSQSLTAGCAGDYACTSPGSPEVTMTRLGRVEGACYAGSFRLNEDGSATADSLVAQWTGNAGEFRLCAEGECLTCTQKNPVQGSGAAPASGKCAGGALSCGGMSQSGCSSQDGCRLVQHYRYTPSGGTLEYNCEGSAESCDSFDDESSCARQRGCRWER